MFILGALTWSCDGERLTSAEGSRQPPDMQGRGSGTAEGVGTRVRVTLAPGRAAAHPERPGRGRVHQGDWQGGRGHGR